GDRPDREEQEHERRADERQEYESDAGSNAHPEYPFAVASEALAHAVDPEAGDHVHDGEYRLVGDQAPGHPALVDARLRGELRQVEHVDRPGRREEELDDAEVE